MKTKVTILLAILVIATLSATAQENEKRFGIELSSGASFATGKLNETNLNTGFGFEGILHYRFLQHLGVYAGWGWNSFGADDSFAGTNVNFEETGYVLGLQYKHAFNNSPVSYYLRAGGLYNHIETENSDGDVINDTGHGIGFQLAGGFDVPLGKNWSFTPGVKFNALSRNTDFNEVSTDLNYNYVSVRVGFLKTF